MPDMSAVTDGFLRLPLRAIRPSQMRHILSGLDDDLSGAQCGAATAISGYTEWISTFEPTVSLGWDWSLEWRDGRMRCVRTGLPRTNVMLVDEAFRDIGWTQSLGILADVVDSFGWSDKTELAVAERYSG